MAFDLNYTGSTDDEVRYVAFLMMLFGQARVGRVNFEVQWEESAAMCWPAYRNSFAFGHTRAPGMKYTEYQVDTAGSIASHRFMSICDALLTPYNMLWSKIKANDDDLMKDRTVALYYNQVTTALWNARYRAEANFYSQNQLNWQSLGVFGNNGMFIDELDSRPMAKRPGLRYMSTSPGEMYKLKNHQGRTDGFIRHFRWTARQVHQKWPDKTPAMILAALEKSDNNTRWDILHFCLPNGEYDPVKVFDWKGKPYASVYLAVAGQCILERGGYRSFPWPNGGYSSAPEEDYDRGPAQMVLPDLKTLNSEAAMFLQQGHRAATPAYLIADDGLTNLKLEPNAKNYGGMNSDGRPLAAPLATGNIQVTPELMARSEKAVNDAFLISYFPSLVDDKGGQKSVRQVIEEANERGVFLAPALSRQYGEYLAMTIDRELDLMSFQAAGRSDEERKALGMLPRMPPALREAQGDYQTIYCSPLARALAGQRIAGYMRTVEFAKDVVEITSDPSLMDRFDFDEALPSMADDQFVPPEWMASKEQIASKAKDRAAQQKAENDIKALPGQAAMAKAAAIQSKAQTGGNIGGTLSGTPQGGMPMMPGQAQPGGRAFGQPGQQ